MTVASLQTPQSTRRPRHRRRVEPIFHLLLWPTVVLFTLAVTLPAVIGIAGSFTDSVGFGGSKLIGLGNYLSLFSDPSILQAYKFTLLFAVVTCVIVNVVAYLLAIGLTLHIKARTALRAIFVIPMVISGIVIAYVFQYLFNTSLPALATTLHISALEQPILANADLAWLGVVFVSAWQGIPSAMLIYIAGIMAIPADVYEAAEIDGAGGWRRMTSITIPLTAGFILINVIISFKNFMNVYDVIVGLTNGGPGTSTMSVAMSIFNGFTNGDYAYQMANATIFFIIAVIIALLQLRVSRGKSMF